MRRTLASLVILLALPAASLADVAIHTRSTEFRSARTYPFAHSPDDYNDFAFVHQLGPTAAAGAVDLATFSGEHFTSTAAATTGITATMQASTGYGPINNRERWSSSTWLAVVFEVRTNAQQLSVLLDGEIVSTSSGPRTDFSFTIHSLTNGGLIFDAYTHSAPIENEAGNTEWTGLTWNTTLNPGMYLLVTDAPADAPTGSRTGGSSASTSVSISVTFGPQTAPALAAALAPTPGTAALLACLPFASLRRRR